MSGGSLLLPLALPASLESLERDVLHALNCRLDAPALEWLLTHIQSKTVAVPLFVGVVLLAALWRRRRALRALLSAALAFALCMGIATVFWTTLARPRPAHVYETVLREKTAIAACAAQPEALVVRRHASSRPGFPSRHALTAGAFAAAIWGVSRWLGLAGALVALLVAVGRVHGGVHWPSDVAAGLLIGALVGRWMWHLVPWILARFGRRHWVAEPVAEPVAADVVSAAPPGGDATLG